MKNNWSTPGFGKNVSPDWINDELLDVEVVILLQGSNLFGDPVYSYLKLMGKDLKRMFGEMQAGKNFKPADFGSVLAAGRDTPPQEIRDEMKEKYNMIDVPAPKPVNRFGSFQPKFFDD
ncbi:MAG TPA: hypothetical protein VFT64_02600 [Rickettsiales bacterium]|nr:hypothetical protein [Rickettsiales bacterium]